MRNPTTKAVYDFVSQYIKQHRGYAPSIREIAEGTFIGRSTVMRHLDRLEAGGYIEREDYQARSLRLTDKRWPAASCQKRDKCPDKCPPQTRKYVLS